MSDYLARLGARALGVASAVRPAVTPLFSPADRTEAAVTARLAANARAFDASRGESKDARRDDVDTRSVDASAAGTREPMPSADAWSTLMLHTAASAIPRENPSSSASSSWRDDSSSRSRDRSSVALETQLGRVRASLDREVRRAASTLAHVAATAGDRRDDAAADPASRRHAASTDNAHAHSLLRDRESGRELRDLAATSAVNARKSNASSDASDASSDASRAPNIRPAGQPSSLAIRPAASTRDGAGSVAASPHAHATNAAEFLARLGALGPRGRRDRHGGSAASDGAESAPVVRISIGRVEVRGGSPRAVIAPPPAAAPRQGVTLADYLTRKRGEQP